MKKCCNCGGDHTAAYGGCPARKQAVMIQQIRTSRNLSYADAVKAVQKESRAGGQKAPHMQGSPTASGVGSKEEAINPEKRILFIAYVVNCSNDIRSKKDKTKMIIKAAQKFLNIGNLSWEKIQAALVIETSEQSQTG